MIEKSESFSSFLKVFIEANKTSFLQKAKVRL